MSWEAFEKHKKEQPDKVVRCGFCGKSINLRGDYGHYTQDYRGRYKCEQCYYNPGHQYK